MEAGGAGEAWRTWLPEVSGWVCLRLPSVGSGGAEEEGLGARGCVGRGLGRGLVGCCGDVVMLL